MRQKGRRDEVKVEEEERGKGLGRREGGGKTDVLCTACAHAFGSLIRVAAPHKWHLETRVAFLSYSCRPIGGMQINKWQDSLVMEVFFICLTLTAKEGLCG